MNARTRNVNRDFRIVIDDRTGQGPNAFQTLDRGGRPVLVNVWLDKTEFREGSLSM